MIVADTNVITYLGIDSPYTALQNSFTLCVTAFQITMSVVF